MTKMTMVQAINNALTLELQKDKSVIVLGEDVGVDGGVFRVTDGLIDKFGPERIIDTPLAEAGIVGTSVGMSINGLRPVAEIQFSGFLYPAMQEIISHASRMRNRSRGTYTCPLVIRTPYGGGIRALEHHSESMEAMFAHVQGLKVVIPSNPYDAKGLLISAIRDPDPVLYLEPKRIYRSIKMDVPEEEYTIPIGEANLVEEGQDITLVSWGAMMQPTLQAVEQLKEKGKTADVIDLRSMYPMDYKKVTNSVKKTGKCVIVHEAPKTSGLGAELIARINEEALLSLEAPVKRVTGFDTIFPLALSENLYLPNVTRINKAIEEVLNF